MDLPDALGGASDVADQAGENLGSETCKGLAFGLKVLNVFTQLGNELYETGMYLHFDEYLYFIIAVVLCFIGSAFGILDAYHRYAPNADETEDAVTFTTLHTETKGF